MSELKAILVDDEESARDVLANLLQRYCPEVTLLAKCSTIVQAVEKINELKPDLVFLDIEMPNYAGFEIVKFFDKISFEIIFVTAYDKYALRAFEVAAVDYLLKPIDIERLKEAVSRAKVSVDMKSISEKLNLLSDTLKTKGVVNLMVSEKGYQQVINLENIIAIEAQESYSYIHTTDKKFTVSKNLKHFESLLEENLNFIRVHKSWIINKDHLMNYSKSELSIQLTNGLTAKLSKYKKVEFEEAILS